MQKEPANVSLLPAISIASFAPEAWVVVVMVLVVVGVVGGERAVGWSSVDDLSRLIISVVRPPLRGP